jgi:hypothetical protein
MLFRVYLKEITAISLARPRISLSCHRKFHYHCILIALTAQLVRREESAIYCHPERNEGFPKILRCARDDKPVLSVSGEMIRMRFHYYNPILLSYRMASGRSKRPASHPSSPRPYDPYLYIGFYSTLVKVD